jgi:serine/threonine-protein kinase
VTVKLQHESLAHYQLLESLGAGRLGELFRARDTRHGRSVAVRIVSEALARDPDAKRQIVDAASRAAGLSHPAIAATYEAGEADDRTYVATEYVPGEPLSRAVSGLPLHPKRAIEIAAHVADALAELHAADLVHGDVQPSTIRLTPKGQVKLLDAGFTPWTGSGRTRLGASELISGEARAEGETLAWLSPEQALGERIDHRSDLFSLGSVLHLMLTGEAPFSGGTASATILNVLQATPPPARSKRADVPPALDDVIRKALSKSLDGRYDSAAQLAADLRQIGDALDVPDARTAPELTLTTEAAPRSSKLWMIVLLILAALAVAGWLAMR